MFKSVQSKYVASYFQLTVCGAHLVLAVSLVEVERSPELSRHLLQTVVQSVLGQVNRLVLKTPVPKVISCPMSNACSRIFCFEFFHFFITFAASYYLSTLCFSTVNMYTGGQVKRYSWIS